MAGFANLNRRIEALLALLTPPEPPREPLKLPYLVLDWPDDQAPGLRDEGGPSHAGYMVDYEDLLASLVTEEERDLPGYEQHNALARLQARRLGIPCKVYYGFDPHAVEFTELPAPSADDS